MSAKLNKFYRIPKININLPTGGKFYQEGMIDFSIDGSLPIRAMTAKDELMLKSPDALLNGDCLVHIIQSCVPEIKNVKKIFAPDVEAILLGIFYASYGPNMEFKDSCPACKHTNHFEISIREILDRTPIIEYPAIVEIDAGEIEGIPTKISVHIKPYTFETNTRNQLIEFEHSKLLQIMSSDIASDQEKLKVFNDSFKKMVEIKFQNVLDCISKIEIKETINNEIRVETIENSDEINDFVYNADNKFVDPIIAKVDELNKSGVNNDFDATCSGQIVVDESTQTKKTCNHEWKTKVLFNPVNFFVKGSSHSARLK